MEFEQIKELIQLIDSSDLALFEFSDGESHIKMDKSLNRASDNDDIKKEIVLEEKKNVSSEINNIIEKKTEADKEIKKDLNTDVKEEDDDNIKTITSPMVGTFYSKASPESSPFVNEGDVIQKGKVICIIEAMKLMNEIESEFSGKIVKCLVSDGDMVEYGQPLFKIGEE
ncbi:MAG: acetyl-CoA carboxylase biotin carboxyl carrier protein [Clostridium sp.]|nr:acetyl-CoA carboxylase biotin carboxyl carrier protein [Clostridium sp.]